MTLFFRHKVVEEESNNTNSTHLVQVKTQFRRFLTFCCWDFRFKRTVFWVLFFSWVGAPCEGCFSWNFLITRSSILSLRRRPQVTGMAWNQVPQIACKICKRLQMQCPVVFPFRCELTPKVVVFLSVVFFWGFYSRKNTRPVMQCDSYWYPVKHMLQLSMCFGRSTSIIVWTQKKNV